MTSNLPAHVETIFRGLVANLEIELARDVHAARTILRRLIGSEIPVRPQHASGKHLVARIGLDLLELLQVAGSSENFVVAGARYQPRHSPYTS